MPTRVGWMPTALCARWRLHKASTFLPPRRVFNVTVVPGRYLRSSPMSQAANGEERLKCLLVEKLRPSYLRVKDISGGCGSMYEIMIESAEFKGKRLVQQHRMVNEALGDEMKSLHGITIRIGDPGAHK